MFAFLNSKELRTVLIPNDRKKNSKLIIIPTYNESAVIADLIKEIFKICSDTDILVVDDNSSNGTGDIIDRMSKLSNRIKCLHRLKKEGIGPAYIDGFKWAIDNEYKYIMQMDADFSHNPRYIPSLFNLVIEYDLVIGSRYVKGGRVENWSILRKIVSRLGSFYAKMVLGLPINDLTSGFKCFKQTVLKSIGLNEIFSRGYAFQIETTFRAYKKGAKIKELPIVFSDRRVGETKMTWNIFFEAIFAVWAFKKHE